MARGKYKGPKRGAGQRKQAGHAEDDEDERRGPMPQGGRAGTMPDSDSDEGDDEPRALNMFGGMGAPGDLPPNSSDEESDSDESDIVPHGAAPSAPEPPRRRNKNEDEADPEQIRKDIERLSLIRQKREQERLDRIKQEGWDRFAPLSETNKPPGGRPPPASNNNDDDDDDDESDDED